MDGEKKLQIYNERESFFQWDLNQKITSPNFKVGDEVHFANLKQTTALITIAYQLKGKIVADVPNILLQDATPMTIYQYVSDGDGNFTIDKQIFNVNKRVKPDDYVYTETEVRTYESLEERINRLENSGGANLSDYYTKAETDAKIETAVNGHNVVTFDISQYPNKHQICVSAKNNGYDLIVTDDDGQTVRVVEAPIYTVSDVANATDTSRPVSVNYLYEERSAIVEYVDSKIGDIETALDELHTYAQSLIEGGNE